MREEDIDQFKQAELTKKQYQERLKRIPVKYRITDREAGKIALSWVIFLLIGLGLGVLLF